MNKKWLAIILSKLKTFEKPKIKLEQYQTPSEIAATILWIAYMNNDIKGKTIADFGCGNGIFGIGALLLGAKKVYFIDKDKEAIKLSQKNLRLLKGKFYAVFLNKNIDEFNNSIDVVIENPPFGVQKKHADRYFLENAIRVADTIYSLHKTESKNFIEAFANDNTFNVKRLLDFDFPIKATQKFHKKKLYKFKVGLFLLKSPN